MQGVWLVEGWTLVATPKSASLTVPSFVVRILACGTHRYLDYERNLPPGAVKEYLAHKKQRPPRTLQ